MKEWLRRIGESIGSYWELAKEWVWARWTAPKRVKLLALAFAKQAERLRGTEDALKRVADSIERDLSRGTASDLTPAQIERLGVLAEECGDLMRAVGLVLRFGWGACSPYGTTPNRVAVEHEAGHLRAALDEMIAAHELRAEEINAWRYKRQAYGRGGRG